MKLEINKSGIIFLKALCGKYSNKNQAYKNPKLYAHMNIYFRLLPWSLFKNISLYSEQNYEHSPWNPYRQAVHTLSTNGNVFILKNYKIINAERISGGGFESEILKELDTSKLEVREDCEMHFKPTNNGNYKGNLNEIKKCIIERDNKLTYLKSKVELSKNKLITSDIGFDLKTNKKVWGTKHGDLVFDKVLE